MCGYGFNSTLGKCKPNNLPILFISTNFASAKDYTLTTFGQFQTYDGSQFIMPGNFVPVVDNRGFYSDINSSLIGTYPWVPASEMTIKLYFRPITNNGTILQIVNVDLNNFLIVYLQGGFVNVEVLTISQSDQTIRILNGTNLLQNQTENQWFIILIQVYQTNANTSNLSIKLNQGSAYYSLNDTELYIIDTNQWVLGSLTPNCSMKGFYYMIETFNNLSYSLLLNYGLPLCNDAYYTVQSSCFYCGDSCDPRLMCVDTLNCNQCYFAPCSTCNGYIFNGCLKCTNNETAPFCCGLYCRNCDNISMCTVCQQNYYLYENVCLPNAPYGGLIPLSSPIANIQLNTPFAGLYGIFKGGYDAAAYNFFNNPETSDPFPAKNRGLYFNTASFLASQNGYYFPHIFTIGLLIKPTIIANMSLVVYGDIMLIQPFFNILYIQTMTDNQASAQSICGYIESYSNWAFLAVSVSFMHPYSTIVIYMNNITVSTFTIIGTFIINTGNLQIGSGYSALINANHGYQGFVYSIYIWNSPVNDFSTYLSYRLCNSIIGSSCIWDCNITQYFNTNNNTYENCSSNCINGCITSNSCNICSDQLCAVCLDFENNCTSCVPNAAKISENCACNSNALLQNLLCPLCYSDCATCNTTDINGCLTCSNSSKILCEGLCLSKCPNGFINNSVFCEANGYKVINIRFGNDTEYKLAQGIDFINSSLQNNSNNNPIVTPSRGIYFTPASMMTTQSKLLFSVFTCNFWIKIYNEGDIIYKNLQNFNISSQSGRVIGGVNINSVHTNTSLIFMNSWEYYSIVIDYLLAGNTRISIYKNTVLLNTSSSTNIGVFIDNNSSFIIGNSSYASFTGFLWSFSAYNSKEFINIDWISSSCIGSCTSCPYEKTCPSECNFGYGVNNCTLPCSVGCLTCYTSTNCLECYSSATLTINKTCNCPERFYWNQSILQCYYPCFNGCADCNHFSISSCNTCDENYFLINQVCVECPTGYIITGSNCNLNQPLVFDAIFTDITGKITDLAMNRSGIAGNGNSFYPNYDQNDPYYVYNRGYYFNGESSGVLFIDPMLMLGPEFMIEIWFMPLSKNGVIISKKDHNLGTLFAIYLKNGELKGNFLETPYGITKVSTSISPNISNWNYFLLGSQSLGDSDFQFIASFNNHFTMIPNNRKSYIIDILNSTNISIGAEILSSKSRFLQSYNNYFNGFIYEIRIFNTYLNNFNTVQCKDSCTVCTLSGLCLPACNINEYWIEGHHYASCSLCHSECIYGCRDARTDCLFCDDPLCEKCLDIHICDKCIFGAEFSNITSKCKCMDSYINNTFFCTLCEGYITENICYACQEKCISCNSSSCLQCVDNAYEYQGFCYCKLGYSGNDTCDYVLFTVNISISPSNIIYLSFSDDLLSDLHMNDLYIKINQTNLTYSISKFTSSWYAIYINLTFPVTNTDLLCLYFISEIISTNNGLLSTSWISINTYPYSPLQENAVTTLVHSIAGTVTTTATCAFTSTSVLNSNPASLWSFINTIQMIIFIYVTKIQLGSHASGLLLGMRKYNIFPNCFDYLGITFKGSHQFANAKALGFATNSVLGNTGQWITCFLFFISLYYIMHFWCIVLEKTKYKESVISKALSSKCSSYKYGFFLRFWIQAYIEICVACIIALYSSNLSLVNEALNFYIALIFSVTL